MRWAPGRSPALPDDLAPESSDGIQPGPRGGGRDRAHGTSGARTTSRYQPKGWTGGETTLRALCVQPGGRPSRPTSVDLQGAPDQPAQARQGLEGFPQKPQRARWGGAATRRRVFPCCRPCAPPGGAKAIGRGWAPALAMLPDPAVALCLWSVGA